MDAIKNSKLRVGRFTGSKIGDLMTDGKKTGTLGKPAIQYISEKNMERRLNRSLHDSSNARPLTWGKCVEKRAFEMVGMDYIMCSQETRPHPDEKITWWVGSPDAEKFDEGKTVIDFKSPITLKSFCNLVDPLYNGMEGIEAFNAIRNGWFDKTGKEHFAHTDADAYYWQLVSNAIITGSKYAELIIYCPYYMELDAIRQIAKFPDDNDSGKYNWIAYGADDELPYIVDDGYYNNINTIRFEVPQADKDALTERVNLAATMLNQFSL